MCKTNVTFFFICWGTFLQEVKSANVTFFHAVTPLSMRLYANNEMMVTNCAVAIMTESGGIKNSFRSKLWQAENSRNKMEARFVLSKVQSPPYLKTNQIYYVIQNKFFLFISISAEFCGHRQSTINQNGNFCRSQNAGSCGRDNYSCRWCILCLQKERSWRFWTQLTKTFGEQRHCRNPISWESNQKFFVFKIWRRRIFAHPFERKVLWTYLHVFVFFKVIFFWVWDQTNASYIWQICTRTF